MEIVYRELSNLIPNPKNPRNAAPEAIEKLAASIKANPAFFEARPILLSDRTGQLVIIGGERRSEAAKLLRMDKVPTILMQGLSEEQEDEIMVRDNTHTGKWDEKKLAQWDKGQLKKWDVEGIKWPKLTQGAKDDNYNAQQVEERCKDGDVWELGKHRLMCGDSTNAQDVEKLTGGGQIDLLMTDPPYGINAEKMTMGNGRKKFYRGKDWDLMAPDMAQFLSLCNYFCVWGGNYFANKLPITNDLLCWYKNSPNASFSEFEMAWTNYGCNCRLLTHHWAGEEKLHVTMKPLAVIAWAIEKCPETPQTILDLFGGSGTTLIAAEQLNMACYMMEKDSHYCDIILDRWEKYTGMKAKRIE